MQNRTSQWRAVERKRAEYLTWARRKFRVALRRQLMQFQKATEDAVVVGDLSRGVKFISDQPIRDAFNDVYVKVGGGFAVLTNQQLKSAKGYRVKDLVVSDYQDFLQSWVASYAGERIVGITQTSQDLMSRIIQRAFDEGMGIDEAKRLINKTFPQYSIARSEIIARTEIVSASNLGSISSARATGLALNKVWLSTRDNRTREAHASDDVDGQKVGINEMFVVGGENLEFPGDPFGSPGNVINCRCTLFYEESEAQDVGQGGNGTYQIEPLTNLNIQGPKEFTERYSTEIEKAVRELGIKEPVSVSFRPLSNKMKGLVQFDRQVDGSYKFGDTAFVSTEYGHYDRIVKVIRHELRHVWQGNKGMMVADEKGFLWNGKRVITHAQYSRLIKQSTKNRDAWIKYNQLPWEADANEFGGM